MPFYCGTKFQSVDLEVHSSGVATIDRCLGAIEALANASTGLSLGALARELDLPKSAVHRLLQALAKRGYVRQDATSQDYELSLKLATLAFRFLDARRLPDVAQEAIDRLASTVG